MIIKKRIKKTTEKPSWGKFSFNFIKLKMLLFHSKRYREFIHSIYIKKIEKDHYLNSKRLRSDFFKCYRDVFSHDGKFEWSEYKKCKKCKRTYGIESIHGICGTATHLDKGSHRANVTHICRSCGHNLSLCYPDILLDRKMKLLYSSSTSNIHFILDKESHEVLGFIMGYSDSFRNIWKKNIKQAIGKNYKIIDNQKIKGSENVCYIDELGIIKNKRYGVYPVLLLLYHFFRYQYKIRKIMNIKFVILWTSAHSRIINFTKQLGYSILRTSDDGSRLVISVKFKKVLFKLWIMKIRYL